MCGITAFVALQGVDYSQQKGIFEEHESLEKKLDESLEIIKHRGPDARGQWISSDCRVGLGHVRLSIIDLSPDGNQPFHDGNDEIHAVVNGELYNHEYYKAELAQEYDFKGNSDCEIVIALYKHYGLSFLTHLRGEFALVLWDAKRKLFFAARDRYGIKSLYYTMVNNQLLVATEMKSFLAFGWQPEWCVRGLREHSWQFNSETFFQGTHRVLPGHYLISRNLNPIEQKLYWDMEYPDKKIIDKRSEEEIILGVRERLLEAIRLRLRADVGVGIYLSGGLDSSALAGIVVHLRKEEGLRLGNDTNGGLSCIKCLTVQFDKDSGVDESDIAGRTAEWLGVDFHPVYVDEEAMASRFEDTVWHSETPLPDVNGMGRLALAEKAHAQGLKVILTGEGSDEHFAGYADFGPDALLEPDPSWPPSFVPEADRFRAWQTECENKGAVSTLFGENSAHFPASTARMLNHTSLPSRLAKFFYLPFASWTDSYLESAPETALAESLDGRVRDAITNKWHPLHTSEYIWTKTILQNYLLRYLGDHVDMAHHIETRPPFLDHHLAEYVNMIPPSLKMKYTETTKTLREKYILREAVKPFITEEVYNRTKQSYLGPSSYGQNGPLYQVMKQLLTRENIDLLGFLDWEAVQTQMVNAFQFHDRVAFRRTLSVAQFVVLGRRFGVKAATKSQDV